jgi:hypothetical protein
MMLVCCIQAIKELQPHAVGFNGYGVSSNPIRWIGTEMGHAPDPTWSTSSADECLNGGAGTQPDTNTVWCPAEDDLTLQNDDYWYLTTPRHMHTHAQQQSSITWNMCQT